MKRIIILFYLLSGLHLTAQTQTITNPIYDKQSAPKEYKITKIIKSPTSIEFYIVYNPVKPYTYENRILESNMYIPKLTDLYTGKTYYGKRRSISVYKYKLTFNIENAKDIDKIDLYVTHTIKKEVSYEENKRKADKILTRIKMKENEFKRINNSYRYYSRQLSRGRGGESRVNYYAEKKVKLNDELRKLRKLRSDVFKKDVDWIDNKIIIKNIYVDLNPNLKVDLNQNLKEKCEKTIASIYQRDKSNELAKSGKINAKILKYLKKNKLAKAEFLVIKNKKNKKYNNKHTNMIFGDKEFIMGMEFMKKEDYQSALNYFFGAKLYYRNANKTDDELQFIDRKIGICYVKKSLMNNISNKERKVMIDRAYFMFRKTKNYDLIKKYEKYFNN